MECHEVSHRQVFARNHCNLEPSKSILNYETSNKHPLNNTPLFFQEVTAIDNVMKNKLNLYTQNKNALQTLQRKQT